MSSNETFNIKEAAKLSGLTPSVLRVWEFRYGWPSPKRSRNGYRCFTRPQVDDLVRAAKLVKNGMPVSRLIVDGYPRWPAEQREGRPQREVSAAHHLPEAQTPATAIIRERVLTALDQANGGKLFELVSSACVTVRPREELHGVVLPAVIGIQELVQQGRRLTDHLRLLDMLGARARQLLRRGPAAEGARPVTLVPLAAADVPVAWTAAAVLADRGRSVSVLAPGAVPPADASQVVAVGLGELPAALAGAPRLAAVGSAGALGLDALAHLNASDAIPHPAQAEAANVVDAGELVGANA